MRWNDCIGSYKEYISLGSTCQTAHQLKRLGLRQSAGPLDWFVSESVPHLVKLIRNRFHGFMELKQLQLFDKTLDSFVVWDHVNDIISFHDFPLSQTTERWWEPYPAFKVKLDRRVKRFFKTVKRTPVLFVRTQTSKDEAQELQAALNTIISGEFRLLIVNDHLDDLKEVIYEDWDLDGICSVMVPPGDDWRGSNQAWDEIMSGFKLK